MPIDLITDVRVSANGGSGLVSFLDLSVGNQNGLSVDRLGFGVIAFALSGNDQISGTGNLYLQHSDDNVTFSDIPVAALRNRAAGVVAAGVDGRICAITAIGSKAAIVGTTSKKRYFRLRQGESAAPTGAVNVIVLRAEPLRSPVTLASW